MAELPRGRRLAVLGSPIVHSRSPVLHRAAYGELGLDWTYEVIEMTGEGIAPFVRALREPWRGLSLTMPLKRDVIPALDGIDRVARLTNAVNTVLCADDGRRLGFNTDVAGIVRALRERGVGDVGRAVLVGAGATATSALVALAELGAEWVEVYARTPEKAAGLVALGGELGVAVHPLHLSGLAAADGASLAVSCLPGGTAPGVPVSDALVAGSTLFDVAYAPWPTATATVWADAGRPVISGLPMLLHQALVQVRIFALGDPEAELPDETSVLRAMRHALGDMGG
ncbi:shikimate 5-dehydrogenase [Agromyces rhizosphaerae]|uniref:Shikimate 5-dehydrogenase n=1 Tax=Agromyces rhizosphaerae TaxID=88374 RepID=A0A9W6D368_9MICO|nr:shikimate dehydrogenase [Agromyces rhizosphaerae]GLI28793.1 shikimate 5-dehydrogenase [Agromyces rhizosphaerae]